MTIASLTMYPPKQEGYQSEGTITSLEKQTDTKDVRCDVEAE